MRLSEQTDATLPRLTISEAVQLLDHATWMVEKVADELGLRTVLTDIRFQSRLNLLHTAAAVDLPRERDPLTLARAWAVLQGAEVEDYTQQGVRISRAGYKYPDPVPWSRILADLREADVLCSLDVP